jgi:hypothetical protein
LALGISKIDLHALRVCAEAFDVASRLGDAVTCAAIKTSNPFFANCLASSKPMPDNAPVTTANDYEVVVFI